MSNKFKNEKMKKGDVVKRKGFSGKFEIIADCDNKDTGFAAAMEKTYTLKDGYDFVIVNIDEAWPKGKIRPYEQVKENEIELY